MATPTMRSPDEQKELAEIVDKINDLFSGNLSEGDMVDYVTNIKRQAVFMPTSC